jgi:hypothetical protein
MQCELSPVEHRAAIFVFFALSVRPGNSHDVPQLLEKYDDRTSHSIYDTSIRICLLAFVGEEDSEARWMG